MPRFDPPHYLIESDGLRMREAPRQAVHGHYLGALGAAASTQRPLTVAEQKAALKNNRRAAQREIDKKAPGKVTINPDGSLHLVNPLTPLNQAMADLLRPAHGAIDASPLPQALKTKLKSQPVTFFVDLFDPVLDAIRDALIEVMERGLNRDSAAFKARTARDTGALGVGGFVYDLSTPPFIFTLGKPEFRSVNIWLFQPGDDLFDEESRGIILRMRMLLAYFVLFFRKPVELQTTLLHKGLDFLFGKDDTQLVSTLGEEQNSRESPSIVDKLPRLTRGEQVREGTFNNRVVYRQTIDNKTVYYALSEKGLRDRKAALQADYDRKYAAYVQDFKFWHPDFAARVGIVRATEGKTEQQALGKVAAEYNLPGRFANERNLPTKFRVDAGQQYGFGVGVANGKRIDLKGLAGLGALGADPATTTTATAAAKGTADAGTAAGGGQAGAATFAAWCDGIAKVVAAVGPVLLGILAAVNRPAEAEAEAREAEAKAAEAAAKAGGLQAQSAGGGISPVLVLAAVGLGILALRKAKA